MRHQQLGGERIRRTCGLNRITLHRTPRRDHVTEVLIDLYWLRIEERIVYKNINFHFLKLLLIVLPHCICVN